MFNIDITALSNVNPPTVTVPRAVFNSAVNFYKIKLGARDLTPRGKPYVLLESSYGFQIKVARSSSRNTGGTVRLSLTRSVDRQRPATGLSANRRPTSNSTGNVLVAVDPFGIMWRIVR